MNDRLTDKELAMLMVIGRLIKNPLALTDSFYSSSKEAEEVEVRETLRIFKECRELVRQHRRIQDDAVS